MWIAKQALETTIPSPWVECQTEGGDVYYYNSRTKESIWDHPFDSFYKRAISRFKSGEITKEQLTATLSESWLLSGVDARTSSSDDGSPLFNGPVTGIDPIPEGSPTNHDPPKLIVALPSDSDIQASPPDHASPTAGRRRRPSVPSLRLSQDVSPSRDESAVFKARIEELTQEVESLKSAHDQQISTFTKDLLKAGEYIEVLRADNRSMRARIADAAVRARDLQKDYLVMKQKLSDEMKKLELAEQIIFELENRLAEYEGQEESPNGIKNSNSLFARLCGGQPSNSSVRRRPPTRNSSSVSRRPSRPIASTPPSQRENDPYKDLMLLLSSPPPSPVKP